MIEQPQTEGKHMQLHAFTDGGAVGHKLIDGRVSAWWDKAGKLVDCERRDRAQRMVKPSANVRARLARMGPAMVATAHKLTAPAAPTRPSVEPPLMGTAL